ncbi:MAG: ribosome biogenesis GTPase Der [Candidatus Saccharibacteria bacterium]
MKVKNLPIVTLVGLPNSGKSTLFNRLTHSNRAIISDIENTTRDVNKATVRTDLNKGYELIDTAGYTNMSGDITKAAMEQLKVSVSNSDLVLYVVDGTIELNEANNRLARVLRASKKPIIVVANKADNDKIILPPERFRRLGFEQIEYVSAIHSIGIPELTAVISSALPKKGTLNRIVDIRVAILGRPNVGKSSLLNSLAGDNLAIESVEAGTTRDTNEFAMTYHGQQITFIDTAGLRKPGKIAKSENIEFYSKVRTKKAIENADICLMLVDSNEPATAQDLHLLGMVKDAKRGLIVVGTKWDSVEKEDHTMSHLSEFIRSKMQFVWWAPLVFTSAKTHQNIDELLKVITEVYSRLDFKLTTAKLNRFLEDANAKNPPSAIKTKKPKVNYITQTGEHPPKFTIFSTHPEFMHWSYTRFLENQFRKEYDLNGVPITIEYKSKYKEGNRDRYKGKK